MTYEIYRYVFLGGAVACGIMLVISVVLFFTLRIPKVISDLTGRTARKAIENIRMHNERTGDKTYQSSAVNLERGKITDKISGSGRLITRDETPFGTGMITEKISTQELPPDEPAGETALLQENTEPQMGETALLDTGVGETAVLNTEQNHAAEQTAQVFAVEYEITFIHTNEVIPQEVGHG